MKLACILTLIISKRIQVDHTQNSWKHSNQMLSRHSFWDPVLYPFWGAQYALKSRIHTVQVLNVSTKLLLYLNTAVQYDIFVTFFFPKPKAVSCCNTRYRAMHYWTQHSFKRSDNYTTTFLWHSALIIKLLGVIIIVLRWVMPYFP